MVSLLTRYRFFSISKYPLPLNPIHHKSHQISIFFKPKENPNPLINPQPPHQTLIPP